MNVWIVAAMLGWAGLAEGLPDTLELPPRPASAAGGRAFAAAVSSLPLKEREARVVAEILAGNVPTFVRTLHPVRLEHNGRVAVVAVTGDYLAVGSDDDPLRMPLSPRAAQRIADRLGGSLPTPRIVDAIHKAATIKLVPSPIPPSSAMTTVPVFLQHNATIEAARSTQPPGGLVAGHKKDVVIANRAFEKPGRVAIHGWQKPDGTPIQPLFAGHVDTWVDYSHGIRLVSRRVLLDGVETTLEAILGDPALAPLLSGEGVMHRLRYPNEDAPGSTRLEIRLDRGVRVVIDRPEGAPTSSGLLVLYAVPNGNTIEQTIGKAKATGDDWRFDIQHIGAQTAFVRRALGGRAVVAAYLENDLKSWPAWRARHGDDALRPILEAVERPFDRPSLVLAGHSGGGSLIFGLINACGGVPERVERIAFLDANYAYDSERHLDPLVRWLDADAARHLVVLAYDDARALLNGKPFVSDEGGTWGRSHRMFDDLGRRHAFTSRTEGALTRHEALGGRIRLLLLENPERKILHTVQVERNGFIECLLLGTAHESVGYRYLGPRAYEGDIPSR